MKIIAKNNNSVSPLVIETNDGKEFEISGELIKGGYWGYGDSLVLIEEGLPKKLDEFERAKYIAQILYEFKQEKVSTKFEIS